MCNSMVFQFIYVSVFCFLIRNIWIDGLNLEKIVGLSFGFHNEINEELLIIQFLQEVFLQPITHLILFNIHIFPSNLKKTQDVD